MDLIMFLPSGVGKVFCCLLNRMWGTQITMFAPTTGRNQTDS